MEKVNGCTPINNPLLPEKPDSGSLDDRVKKKKMSLPEGVWVMLNPSVVVAPPLRAGSPSTATTEHALASKQGKEVSVVPDAEQERLTISPAPLTSSKAHPTSARVNLRLPGDRREKAAGMPDVKETVAHGGVISGGQSERTAKAEPHDPGRRGVEKTALYDAGLRDADTTPQHEAGLRDAGKAELQETGTHDAGKTEERVKHEQTRHETQEPTAEPLSETAELPVAFAALSPVRQTIANPSDNTARSADLKGMQGDQYEAWKTPENGRLKFHFHQWGNGHSVTIQIAKEGTLKMHPSTTRVEQQISAALKEAGDPSHWEIEALTGDSEMDQSGENE